LESFKSLRKDIDRILAEKGIEALFLYSESFKDPNMYYLTKFLAPDPFMFLKKVDNDPVVVINSMEYPRAQKESIIRDVRSYADYDFFNIIKSEPDPKLGGLKFIASVIKKELGVGTKVYAPPSFPTMVADALRKEDLAITPLFDVIEKARETKETDEINEIKTIQAIVDKVTKELIDLISNAEVDANGTLMIKKDGKKEPFTVRDAKSFFGHEFLDQGCVMEEEIIVACGSKGANPHYFGSPEDKLKANQPIILDVFPRSLQKRYWTDMTRTIVKGKASKEVKKMFEAVLEAKNASFDSLKAGMSGREIFDICCNLFEKAGYATIRGGKQITKGFLSALGHGVGLEIHEGPVLHEYYKFALEEHNVVTVEPGLYDPDVGGIRIEDIVEITRTGCNNLTRMGTTLEV
jgi:Xaa-Pro aminopeptidase